MNWQKQTADMFGENSLMPLARLSGMSVRTIRNWRDNDCAPLWFVQKINETYRIWRQL